MYRAAMDDLERANAASREGRHEDAIPAYALVVASATLPLAERLHAMCQLVSAYRLTGRWEAAEAAARSAIEATVAARDPEAEGHAQLSLATVLLDMFDAGMKPDSSDELIGEAFEALESARARYQQLNRIDSYTCLFMMGEALLSIGEGDAAEGIFNRIGIELCDEKWSKPQDVAYQADYLRGRAFYGLARIAFEAHDDDKARDRLDTAVRLLTAGGYVALATHPLLEDIANDFREKLDDSRRADEILEWLRLESQPS